MSSESKYLNDQYKGFFEDSLSKTDPDLYKAINDELRRQQQHIELIASENIVSQAVLEAQGSVLTNKYAEGYLIIDGILIIAGSLNKLKRNGSTLSNLSGPPRLKRITAFFILFFISNYLDYIFNCFRFCFW